VNQSARSALSAALALVMTSATCAAQTDFYNTEAGRPMRIEDAYALEHRGFELQASPLRLERGKGGQYRWGIEPAVEYGLLPRTQVEVGFPLAWIDAGTGANRSGLAGIDLSVLHNLNVETSWPALAIVADVLLPVGNLAAGRAYPSLTAIATRTLSQARFHLNAQYTFGDAPAASTTGTAPVGAQIIEVSRWLAGVAIDHTFPLRSTLISAEVFAQGDLANAADVTWNSTIGTRYQVSPRWALDAGIGRRLTGPDQSWSVTFGGAYAFGLPWSR
jgi:hypothetical protein